MKKINTLLTLFFFAGIGWGIHLDQVCALNQATLEIDQETVDVNETIRVQLKILIDHNENLKIGEIPGIDKFVILNNQQSERSFTSFVKENGTLKSVGSTILSITLTLSPKEKGTFSLGGGTVQIGTETIKTNTVKVVVTGEKIMLNQSAPPQNNQSMISLQIPSLRSPTHSLQMLNEQTDVSPPSTGGFAGKGLITIIFSLLLFGLCWWGILKMIATNPPRIPSYTSPTLTPSTSLDGISLSDPYFLEKIESYFHSYLKEKHRIISSETLTYSEIAQQIDPVEQEKILNFTKALTKAKYSPLLSNGEHLLYLLQQIDPGNSKNLYS